MPYIRPSDLWRDGWGFPQALSTESFTPGLVTAPQKTGVGSGTLRVLGRPKDAYDVRVQVLAGGEVGGTTLALRYSLDGGASWSEPQLVQPGGAVELIDLGVYAGAKTFLSLQLGNGVSPSFVANDGWTFATTAPPGLLAAISSASQEADEDLGNALTLPLVAWNDALRERVAQIVVYKLLGTRGFDALGNYDRLIMQRYRDAKQWLRDIGLKDRQSPGLVESSPPVDSPMVLLGQDRFGVMDL